MDQADSWYCSLPACTYILYFTSSWWLHCVYSTMPHFGTWFGCHCKQSTLDNFFHSWLLNLYTCAVQYCQNFKVHCTMQQYNRFCDALVYGFICDYTWTCSWGTKHHKRTLWINGLNCLWTKLVRLSRVHCSNQLSQKAFVHYLTHKKGSSYCAGTCIFYKYQDDIGLNISVNYGCVPTWMGPGKAIA